MSSPTSSRPTWQVIVYWLTTALVALAMVAGGAFDALQKPEVLEGLAKLGYPAHFAIILGIGKLLGGITILLPKLPRLKEWAYAGISIDLISAAATHAIVGDPLANIATPLALLTVMFASWWLRPASRTLA